MVELLVVIIVIAVLIGLLLPAINAALRTARKAAVSSEINQIASALAAFKTQYGDYPPSRIYVAENGDYGSAPTTQIAPGDLTYAQLAQRTASYLRKFWPRMVLNTAGQGALFTTSSTTWYDFNGDGFLGIGSANNYPGSGNGYILEGHECLTFFLGGMPVVDSSGNYGVSGFSKDPTNPFTSIISAFGTNRSSPLFEFVPSRLFADPNDTYTSGVPGYYDSLGAGPPTASAGALPLNFYAYFSAYGNNNYDPNDVNCPEVDANGNGHIGLLLRVSFQIPGSTGVNIASSAAPNPYTSTLTDPATLSQPITYLNGQSFQIISSGIDGFYGVGGQYIPASSASSASANALPLDVPSSYIIFNGTAWSQDSPTDTTIRQREADNLTNFKAGSLQ